MNTVPSTRYLPVRGATPAPASWRAFAAAFARRFSISACGLLPPLLLLAAWQHAVDERWLAEQILPPPALVWQSLAELWDSGELASHLSISLSRFGWSLLIGGGVGLLLGSVMGISRSARAYLYPSFSLLSQFPVVGWIPLLIIVAGLGEALKISAISIAVVVPVVVNTDMGIANIPRALLEVAKVYRFNGLQVAGRVVLPAACASIFNGLRQGVMQAWLSLVFVELLASSEGIGYLMVWGRQLLQLDIVVVAMIVIGAVGLLLDRGLGLLESRLQGWRRGAY